MYSIKAIGIRAPRRYAPASPKKSFPNGKLNRKTANVAKNKEAYKYLEESIDQFPNQKKLISILNKIGFINPYYLNIFNGIVSIHIAYKI